jgi:hypothetical protein
MATPEGVTTGAGVPPAPAEPPIPPRADLHDALGWIAFGVAVLVGSITMDRLERQHINPYTIPGLLPGLLGIAMILLGTVLGLRSWRRGAFRLPKEPPSQHGAEERRRIGVVIALCVGYGAVLIGHGLPFWLASAIYVTGSIMVLQRMSGDPHERRLNARGAAKAVVIGLSAALITHVVFQELFLVRLP